MFNQNLEKQAQKALSFLDNEYISVSIKTFLALYVAIWAPRLPKSLMDLFNNNLFKALIFTTILVLSTKDIGLSLMIALGYIVSMMYLKKYVVMDYAMNNVNNNDTLDNLDKELEKELEEDLGEENNSYNEISEDIEDSEVILQNPFENKINYDNRRNNKVVYYQSNKVDYDNDTNTLTTHMYNPDAEEAPGFLNNIENNGMISSTGSNELEDAGINSDINSNNVNNNVAENFDNKNEEDNENDEEQPYKEVVVGAPLHLDHEHNSPQGLNKVKGYEGPSIGGWFEY